ncbi:glycosyltransferase [Gammaproteobacteria bacterium]|nr:glycosyltransferase [Gammaproteobacteria bacterium]
MHLVKQNLMYGHALISILFTGSQVSNSIKITAIICNYNGGYYLKEAINSVLAQDLQPDRLIIVDDKSTDNSVDIILEFQRENPKLITLIQHEKNKGQAAGMNTALASSSGELLAFLDSDDIWFPGKLSALHDAYLANPDFGLYQHNLEVILNDENTGEFYMSAMTHGDVFDLWKRFGTFPRFSPTSGLAIRKDICNKLYPIPEELTISADSYITRTAICLGSVVSVFEPLGGYRKHSANSVYGNTEHDAVKYFQHRVSPLLNQFYKSHGIVTSADNWPARPIGPSQTFIDKLLDVSLRKIIQQIKN